MSISLYPLTLTRTLNLNPNLNLLDKNDLLDIDDLNSDIARAALRLLERKKLPIFKDCFSKNVERGLYVRPSCRFEVLTKSVKIVKETKEVQVRM
jgi:hypothetical protein